MKSYSVAIRTLGLSVDTLRKELVSLHNQTIAPDSIDIYIAQNYAIPDFRIGIEQYHYVPKGMVAQRALLYDNVSSDYLLLLDDDVELAPDSVERLIAIADANSADCVAADTFQTHNMSFKSKARAAIVNFSLPRFNQRWAVTVRPDDSFSYINKPCKVCYPTQSAAGPAALWRTESFRNMHFEDEVWLDHLGFAYGDDGLEFFKLYLNGGRLFMAFETGVVNLNAKTSSANFQRSSERFRIMAKSNICRWHRMHYSHKSLFGKAVALSMMSYKVLYQLLILSIVSIKKNMRIAPKMFCIGVSEGIKLLRSDEYKSLPTYKL